MNYLVRKHEATAYPAGMKLVRKRTGERCTIVRECTCTDSLLHYEVLKEGDTRTIVYQHREIEMMFDVA